MGTGLGACVSKWLMMLEGSVDLYIKLCTTEHPILGHSLCPTCTHLVLSCIARNYGYHIVKGMM